MNLVANNAVEDKTVEQVTEVVASAVADAKGSAYELNEMKKDVEVSVDGANLQTGVATEFETETSVVPTMSDVEALSTSKEVEVESAGFSGPDID